MTSVASAARHLLFLAATACGPRPAPEPTSPAPPVAAVEEVRDVLYFVLVDRFANGSPDAPGSTRPDDPQGWHGGDLRGLTRHLDDLQALGVGGIWLSPITRTRTEPIDEWGAFHGYWVSHLDELEPRFGTRADATHLAEQLKARGMQLWLDMVYNHVGYDTPLVSEHPEWFHGLGDVTDWDDPVEAVTHDVHGLPDLAQEREPVYQHLLDASVDWVSWMRPTGLRIDAVRHLPEGFLRRMRSDLRETDPELQFLGEVFEGHAGTLAARQRADQLDRVFDFPLHYAMKDVFCGNLHTGRIASTYAGDRSYDDPSKLVTFLDNHDVSRIASACGEDTTRLSLALAFLVSSRGQPCLTWGTEVPLVGAEEPANRADMVFDPSIRSGHVYRSLQEALTLRARSPALRSGTTEVLHATQDTLVIRRTAGREVVDITVHLGTEGLESPFASPAGATPTWSRVLTATGFAERHHTDSIPAESLTLTRYTALDPQPPTEPTDVQIRVTGVPEGGQAALVGMGPALGDWDPAHAAVVVDGAVTLRAHPGDVLAFKIVLRHPDGRVSWEPVEDRYLHVERGAAPTFAWGQP